MADEVSAPAASAPAAAPAAAPASAPAAPTTTTTTTDVKRPTSFGAALRHAEKEGSSSSTPAADAPPAAATVLPTDAGPTSTEGPVPYSRFSEVNTAKKSAEARVKEIENKLQALAWAEGLDRQLVTDTVQWRSRAHSDLDGFVRDLIATAPADRQAQLRSAFARQLATRNDPEPQPDIQTDTGQPVYSARQLSAWYQWQSRKQQVEFDKQLAPLKAEATRNRQVREQAVRDQQTHAFANTTAKEAAEWPHFQAHVKEIVAELQKLPPGETEAAEALALHKAYLTVLKRSVLPGLSGKTEAAVLADLKTKAVAASEHPGRANTAGVPARPTSMGASLRAELAKAGVR